MTLADCTNYIILKVTEDGATLNLLKLQKLAYYAQAWHLAFHDKPLFAGEFEAWVHGPVSRDLYKRFASTKTMYAPVGPDDITPGFDMSTLEDDDLLHIDNVLEVYAGLTGSQLEEMSHRELPWLEARRGIPASQSSRAAINETTMATFYRSQLPHTV